MQESLKKGQELTVTVDGLAFGGKGFCRYHDLVVFIERALPDQTVRIRISRQKQNYAEAKILEVIQESPFAIAPRCPHFGLNGCGGCLWQNLNYTTQLEFKQQQVQDCLEHLGGFTNFQTEKILPADPIFFYRNKMEFSFSDRPWYPDVTTIPENGPQLALGLHVPKRFDRILDITDCQLLSPLSNQILATVKEFARNSGIKPWCAREHTGFWRHLVAREGKNTGQLMLNLVTSPRPEHFPALDELAQQLHQTFPEITTIIHTVNRKPSDTAVGEVEKILLGPGRIVEQLDNLKFIISANSFFQTNSYQAKKLYDQIAELAALTGSEVVYDLYCGTGTISCYLAAQAARVIGFELVPQAIQDANENLRLNNISNCRFIEGDLKDQFVQNASTTSHLPSPDVLITDPPRAGMHPEVIQQIVKHRPPKIIYVSCNPATFARDVKLLSESGYELQQVRPVDMFPHTAHCEVVGVLVGK